MSGAERPDTLRYYRDAEGKWRWQFKAANGRILADSGQGYSSRSKAEQGWRHITLACGERAWFLVRVEVTP